MHFLCTRADVSVRGIGFNRFVRIVAQFYSTIWILNALKALPKKQRYLVLALVFIGVFFASGYAGIAFVSLIHDILYCAILFIFYIYLNNSIQLILIIQFYGVQFYWILFY